MSIFLPFAAVTGRHLAYLKNTNGGLTKVALEGRSFALGYGHAVQEYRAPRGRPIAQWVPMFDALGQHEMEAIYARLVERHGEDKAKRIAYSNRNLLIFPNLVINGIMAITIRTFYPTAPNQLMVNGWALAPNEESELARKYQLYNFLEFLGPDGFATPDDVEALESCQNCSRDHHNLVLVLVLGAVPCRACAASASSWRTTPNSNAPSNTSRAVGWRRAALPRPRPRR